MHYLQFMLRRPRLARICATLLIASLPSLAPAQPVDAAREARIAAVLEKVLAIDNHTHLLTAAPPYNPRLENTVPVMLRSARPETVAAMKSRFNVDWDPAQGEQRRRGERDREDLRPFTAVQGAHGIRRRREQCDGAQDPDRQGQPIPADLLQKDADHQATGSVTMLSP